MTVVPRVRLAVPALVCCLLLCATVPASARSKSGPVFMRGVAARVGSGAFTLVTTRKGSFTVRVSPDTSVTMAGKRAAVGEGDHVGVRGFQSSRAIRAIWVHIYSVAASQFSLSGTVVSIGARRLTVRTGGRTREIVLTARTTVVIGATTARSTDIRRGERVLVRVEQRAGTLTALHIHVYRSTHRTRVSLSGSVVFVAAGTLTVKAADVVRSVRLRASTVVYLGAERVSASALRVGQTVRVYACCAGSPLVATSVHIHRSVSHAASQLIHGTIAHTARGRLTVLVAGKPVVITVTSSTVFEIGSSPSTVWALRVGDDVSVRARRVRGGLLATRVHVLAASRALHHLTGTVVSVRGNTVVVLSRGRQYMLDTSAVGSIRLGGSRVPVAALRRGDTVTATGTLHGTVVRVTALFAVRHLPAVKTFRGEIVTATAGGLVISDGSGSRYTVRYMPNVHPTLDGHPAPPSALFPGAHVTVKGVPNGNILTAHAVTVSVTVREVPGRLTFVSTARLRLISRGRTVTLDLSGSPAVRDRGHDQSLGALDVGTFVAARGYVLGSDRLRATRIKVQHPSLDITGTLVLAGAGYRVHVTGGEVYRVHVGEATEVSAGAAPVTLAMENIPAGVHVHVAGTARTDGSLSARSVAAHLRAVSLRGTIAFVSGSVMGITDAAGQHALHLDPAATLLQGSRSLLPTDVVVGDDATADGYTVRAGILVRKLMVHRPLVGLDGTVGALGAGGLTLLTPTGSVRVAIGADTQVTGAPTVGMAIHVTGYRRGDGVILATRVRPK